MEGAQAALTRVVPALNHQSARRLAEEAAAQGTKRSGLYLASLLMLAGRRMTPAQALAAAAPIADDPGLRPLLSCFEALSRLRDLLRRGKPVPEFETLLIGLARQVQEDRLTGLAHAGAAKASKAGAQKNRR